MERQDASALVTAFLQEEVGTNMLHKSYKLLNCREHASKREIEAIDTKSYLVLHPDRQGLRQWLQSKQVMLDSDIYVECTANVL